MRSPPGFQRTNSLIPILQLAIGPVILISGVGTKGPDKLPTLVLHGDADASASYEHAKAYASAASNRKLVTWKKGSHYAFLYERDSAADVISSWLATVVAP